MPLRVVEPNETIDLSGMRCPNLLIGTLQALNVMAAGQILRVIATDLNAPSNMVAWVRQTKHELVEMYEENGRFVFLLRRCPDSPQPVIHQQSEERSV